MKIRSSSDLDTLVQKFTDCTLSKVAWTHEAHLIVGLWHNWHFEFHQAISMVKTKIIAYNESVGTLNTATSGYHETMTLFWMIITKEYLQLHEESPFDVNTNTFLLTPQASRTYPLEFYSSEVLFSKKARKEWVNGNLKKLNLP